MRSTGEMVFETIRLERPTDGIVVATLNRPERLNAMTVLMFQELEEMALAVDGDDDVRVLIITGAGRAFCAGYDLDDAEELSSLSPMDMLKRQERAARALATIRSIRIPVIAAINGTAAGGGLSLTLVADIRLAAPSARFNAAFVRIGLSAGDMGASWLLPRIVGPSRVAEIGFTGRFVEAEEAEHIGLVNKIVSAGTLLAEAVAMAELIRANSPGGVQLSKRALQANMEVPSYTAALELENRGQVVLTRDEDIPEVLDAFKREHTDIPGYTSIPEHTGIPVPGSPVPGPVTTDRTNSGEGGFMLQFEPPKLETLTLEPLEGGNVLLTVNRPTRMNSLTVKMFEEFNTVAYALRDTDARALILTGAGDRAFCAGFDLDEIGVIGTMGVREFLRFQEMAAGGFAAIRSLPFPVIAAIHGAASGGGLALALAADIRLVAPTAKFNAPFVRLGLSIGDLGTSWQLTRLVGPGRAAEIAYTVRTVEAEEAVRIGLANRLVPSETLLEEALAMAKQIAGNSPAGIRMSKRALQYNLENASFAAALELENRGQALLTRGEDMTEALAAFKARRPPQFTGK
ncbi:enoyl-CoA hydratase/isomerase [Candidatus Protofrankia californiensis]|uniref:Enoyl-CoA hydratase/isomerase n=2 Tax=Protofrankia TaxID=2994361 RepID=A0A1C3NYY7_9ACTN|nr:enoyl-CoA hydratase/isomerase family protein [Protofrankia symbiont of Coriaria ruscifolia]SBW22783.1 enoyl-CoA hydratase/isomerase [Candidatus Protofrankia californiensis]